MKKAVDYLKKYDKSKKLAARTAENANYHFMVSGDEKQRARNNKATEYLDKRARRD